MKAEMEKLIRNSFIAFAFKCYATINTGRRLKLARYLELLAKEFELVGRARRASSRSLCHPVMARRQWAQSRCRRGLWAMIPQHAS